MVLRVSRSYWGTLHNQSGEAVKNDIVEAYDM
jgi:hypothetical protein